VLDSKGDIESIMDVKDLLVLVGLWFNFVCLVCPATAPTPGVCKDKKKWCMYYKCSSAFVRKFCPKQCGLCATVGPTLSQPQCGRANVTSQRLITSTRTPSVAGAHPWQVALFYKDQFFCGGVLVAKRYVITGAQCVTWFGSDVKQLKVVLGEYNIYTTEGTEMTIPVKRKILHPSFNITQRNHDIAILELSRDVKFSKHVQPICLPDLKEEVKAGTQCVMTGWGRNFPEWKFANQLEQTGAPVVDLPSCRTRNNPDNIPITDNMICTGYENPRSTRASSCHGDSGGPIACKTREGVWKVQGVISWGSMTCNGAERFTVSTRVSAYRGWIDKNIK